MKQTQIVLLIAQAAVVSLGAWGANRTIRAHQFRAHCTSYLERATRAPTVELALQSLDPAIAYLEATGRTAGFTSIFTTGADDDVGYYYQSLVAARDKLLAPAPPEADRSTVGTLLILRQALTGQAQNGRFVMCPEGISVFPHNRAYFLWCLLSLGLAVVALHELTQEGGKNVPHD